MITDWRGERRIGARGIREALLENVRWPVVALGVAMSGATLNLFLQNKIGGGLSHDQGLRMWCFIFLVLCGVIGLPFAKSRGLIGLAVLAVLAASVTGLVWLFALPVLGDLGVIAEPSSVGPEPVIVRIAP